MSQKLQILNHLKNNKSITPLEALADYDCMRLGARCFELRKLGYPIRTVMVERNGKRFAEYVLDL